ncbi:MAG: adenylosuccinate lyase [Patescibacteria group bacterium]|nr:adenylosuccinate lyase [Patescibacteria group bacterium]
MYPKYVRPNMEKVWSEENKLDLWLRIEIAIVRARVKLGEVPAEALVEIEEKATFDKEEIRRIEGRTQHDVVAFLEYVGQRVGESSKYLHEGITSSDILDTAFAIQLGDAARILISDIKELLDVLVSKADEYADTICVGRTHGMHAEPMVFGLKFGNWAFEMHRNLERLKASKDEISFGKISGPVGTYSNVNPQVEEDVCFDFCLEPDPVSNQIIQRDRHAHFMSVLAVCAGSLERIALEIRSLQRPEIGEAAEPFGEGQKGSSAMPHKRNPILCERVCGLARVIRGYAQTAFENQALYHERDISHSSAERVIFPDATKALDYILSLMTNILENLEVSPEKMLENLKLTKGLVFSSRVLTILSEKCPNRQMAYEIVQRVALKASRSGQSFKRLLLKDAEVRKYLSPKEIADLFDVGYYIRNTGKIFARLGELEY